MELPVEETEIGGLKIRTRRLSVMVAAPMWVRVLNVLAPVFDALPRMDPKLLAKIALGFESGAIEPMDIALALAGLGPSLEKLDADAFSRVLREIFVSTSVIRPGPGGKPVKIELQGPDKINQAFGADIATALRAALWVARLNFAGFTAAGRNVDGDAAPASESST